MWQNQNISKHGGSDTMNASEMSRNISNISTHIEKQAKRVCELERVSDDSAPTFSDNN